MTVNLATESLSKKISLANIPTGITNEWYRYGEEECSYRNHYNTREKK